MRPSATSARCTCCSDRGRCCRRSTVSTRALPPASVVVRLAVRWFSGMVPGAIVVVVDVAVVAAVAVAVAVISGLYW